MRQDILDQTSKIRRLWLVSSALTQGGIKNMGRDALEQTLLLLDRRISEIAQPTKNKPLPIVVDSSDYISWAIKARKLLISGWGCVVDGSYIKISEAKSAKGLVLVESLERESTPTLQYSSLR